MKSLVDLSRKWAQLSRLERQRLIQAWAALHVIYAALWIMPFETVRAVCQRVRIIPQPVPSHESSVPAVRQAWLVNVASRYSLVQPSCLHEALTLSWLMSRQGLPSTLRIGVMRSKGDFAAHAWVEQDGHVILGATQTETYTPLFPAQPFEGRPS